jgi:hypothetical protein
MIEINLVPDVKQELLRAQRVRTGVISLSITVGIIAIGCVVLLAVWVFGVQTVRSLATDGMIKDRSQKLAKVEDVNNTLTIQNQLAQLQAMHDDKKIDSRVFDLLQAINPPAPNDVRVTSLKIDSENKMITLQAQGVNGFTAHEVFKKTLGATNIKYTKDGAEETVALAKGINDVDRSYGEDANGAKVLRFTLTFEYPEELFAHGAQSVVVQTPGKKNATDSYVGVPQSLFVQKANDIKETQ